MAFPHSFFPWLLVLGSHQNWGVFCFFLWFVSCAFRTLCVFTGVCSCLWRPEINVFLHHCTPLNIFTLAYVWVFCLMYVCSLFTCLVTARTRRMSHIVLNYCMDAGNLNLGPVDDGSALSGWAISSASQLFSETESHWSSFVWRDRLTLQAQGCSCLCLRSVEIIDTCCYCVCILCRCWRLILGSRAQQAVYQLSHVSNLFWPFISIILYYYCTVLCLF